MQKQQQQKRAEDRRSCHNISFILGLACRAGDADLAAAAYHTMLTLVGPVRGQAVN